MSTFKQIADSYESEHVVDGNEVVVLAQCVINEEEIVEHMVFEIPPGFEYNEMAASLIDSMACNYMIKEAYVEQSDRSNHLSGKRVQRFRVPAKPERYKYHLEH